VPLEVDLTTVIAYQLNDSKLWKLGSVQFREPAKTISSQLLMAQPYDPDRIPVVFVHGTFSSPLTWVEMTNTLAADPILRRRYQLWSFIYGSGNPLIFSMGDLRAALLAKVKEFDPAGTNPRLRQMVLIGHSQGGLLVKSTAVDTGDRLWRAFSAKPFDDPSIPDTLRPALQRLLFLQPLPFVRRVVFIATPHRGGYRNGGLARSLAQSLVSLPRNIMTDSNEMLKLTEGTEAEAFFEGKVPTSVDGMSPKNPALLALAEIPVAKSITAHSIIAVEEDDDPTKRRDGIVTYESAHVDYAQSEFIVNSFHSCLNHPATIEEVRRILHLHLAELPAEALEPGGQTEDERSKQKTAEPR
jgi:pimeloyl-ACP methyl ester carboxylesterase